MQCNTSSKGINAGKGGTNDGKGGSALLLKVRVLTTSDEKHLQRIKRLIGEKNIVAVCL